MPFLRLSDLTDAKTFLANHWPNTPLFGPSIPARKRLLGLPLLQHVETIVANRSHPVRAYLPDFNDEYRSVLLDPADALAAYLNGTTLVFDAIDQDCPELAESLTQLQADLKLPKAQGEIELTDARVIAYATPAGGRTRLHFDANANFVIQLKGSKRWGLAPNTSVTHPTDRYTTGAEELGPALERQCHAPMLEQLPPGSPEYVLEPGAFLFVPRGHWHETFAEEESLSLTFAFSQPTYADLLLVALREELLTSPDWRALATDPNLIAPHLKRCVDTFYPFR